MGKFKKYLKENEDLLQQIYDILDELSDEELDDFGLMLADEFLDVDEDDIEDTFDMEDIKGIIDELSSDMYEDILELLSTEEVEDPTSDLGDWDYEETSGNEYKNRIEVYETTIEVLDESGKGDSKEYQEFLKKAIAKFGGTGVDFDSVPEDKRDELGDYIDKNWVSDDEELDEKVARIMKKKNMNRKKRLFQKKNKSQLRRGKNARKIQARKDKPKRKRNFRKNKKKIQGYRKTRAKAIKKGTHKVRLRRR